MEKDSEDNREDYQSSSSSDDKEPSSKEEDEGKGGSSEDEEPERWGGITAKTMRGIIRRCHQFANHLAGLDDDLKDLGRVGHFLNPPIPQAVEGMSRKIMGGVFVSDDE